MSSLRSLLFTVLASAIVVPLCGMTNADVIKLTKAGVSENTILLTIGNAPAEYELDADGIIELKEAGVSEAVIQKMIAAAGRGQDGAAAPAESAPAEKFASADLPSIAPPRVKPEAGRDYFLRSSIHIERDTHVATNYTRGELIPINTPVQIVALGGDKITVRRRDTGTQFTVDNVPKFTLKNTSELAELLFSAEPTPLDRLPKPLAAAIRAGQPRLGMTKEQVLMARGYPPAHETPSTEGDRWVYWSSRFVKQTLVFADDRLVEGRGIR